MMTVDFWLIPNYCSKCKYSNKSYNIKPEREEGNMERESERERERERERESERESESERERETETERERTERDVERAGMERNRAS